MTNTKPAIVIVAYRRLHTVQRLLKSVEKAIYQLEDIPLIISIDYHPENKDVIAYANAFEWRFGTKYVKTHEENMGLRGHIIECGDYALQYGAVIILEDDDIVAPSFYEYTRKAHDFYAEDERIAGISLYAHEWNGYAGKKFQPILSGGDVYFGQFSCTRGQSWSEKQWTGFKQWYENNPEIQQDELLPKSMYSWKKSWGKYYARYIVEKNKFYVMPYKPVSTVFGEIGTHASSAELDVQIALFWGNDISHFVPFEEGVHYDIFFENVDLKSILAKRHNISEHEVLIDIYAMKNREYKDKRYILTTKKMNAYIVEQYELNMRPHDIGIFLDMRGPGISLYDIKKSKSGNVCHKDNRLEYDFAGIHGLDSLLYGGKHCLQVLCKCLGLEK